MKTKKCTRCQQYKKIDLFSKRNNKPVSRCKNCRNKIANIRYKQFKKQYLKITNLIGTKIGKLTIIKEIGISKNHHKILLCECECGKQTKVFKTNIIRGHTTSCGCGKGIGFKNKDYTISAIKWLISCYKRGAKTRNFKFTLSLRDVKSIITLPCYYCGFKGLNLLDKYNRDVNSRTKTVNKDHRRFNLELIGNGIDRLNSKLGYTKSNCVSCCYQCNTMKLDYTIDEFLTKINDIYKHSIMNKNYKKKEQ